MFNGNLPFDLGPDKADRIFLALNGVHITARTDAGVTSILRGAVLFHGLDGRKSYLRAFSDLLSVAGTSYASNGIIIPPNTLNADQVSPLGYIAFEDVGSVIGTGTVLQLFVWFNIGFYSVYAEPNWLELFRLPVHDHTGLSNYRDIDGI